MAPPLPDDPILPGATWRPLEPQDAATLALPVGDPHVRADLSFVARAGDEAAGYERVGFRVNRRFVRLHRMVAA